MAMPSKTRDAPTSRAARETMDGATIPKTHPAATLLPNAAGAPFASGVNATETPVSWPSSLKLLYAPASRRVAIKPNETRVTPADA